MAIFEIVKLVTREQSNFTTEEVYGDIVKEVLFEAITTPLTNELVDSLLESILIPY